MSRPPTSMSSRAWTAQPSEATDSGQWIVALSESRGVGREVGICGIEKSLSRCVVSQLADSQTYIKTCHWLKQRPPTAILLPHSNDKSISVLQSILSHAFPDIPIHATQRISFSPSDGLKTVSRVMSPSSSIDHAATISLIRQKYYALGSVNAALEWCETKFGAWTQGCLDVQWKAVEGTMLIDAETASDLELTVNILNSRSKHTLFGLLNHTYTPMAARLLRTNILAPCTDVETLDHRLDAVQELVANEEMFSDLRRSLKLIANNDFDKLIGTIAASTPGNGALGSKSRRGGGALPDPAIGITRKIQSLLSLRKVLKAVRPISSAIATSGSRILVAAGGLLREAGLEEINEAVDRVVNQDAASGMEKGALASRTIKVYAVKAHNKPFLDVARETYKENTTDILTLVDELKTKHDLDGLSAKFDHGGAFVLTMKKDALDGKNLPAVFTNVAKKGKVLQFSCLDLKKKNQRLSDSYQEICLLSEEVLDELTAEIQQRLSALFRAAEAVALLDMLASFASVASSQNYTRPEFTDTIAIKNGRHPVQERFRFDLGSFTPNDTYATDACSFQIVTGPSNSLPLLSIYRVPKGRTRILIDMSGKSTFLRQIALLVVMAQIGSYVPASLASFRIHDALLSRLSNDDDIEAGLSTFASEMRSMSTILSALSVCDKSLIIIDELGRGTSPLEGVGIAHALAQEIIESKSFCWFATHFRDLTTTLGVYPNVVCLHLETQVESSKKGFNIRFMHRVTEGRNKQTNYGLELARMAALPEDVLGEAQRVTNKLNEIQDKGKLNSRSNGIIARRGIILHVATTLKQYRDHSRVSDELLKELVIDLQQDTINRLAPRIKHTASVASKIDSEKTSSVAEDGN